MTDTNLGTSINSLKDYTIQMIEKCQDALQKSVNSMVEHDIKLANEVIENDKYINDLRDKIREKSIELFALKQPMAKDLRYVYSLAIISNELERIGDYAVNISKETIKIGSKPHMKPLVDIPKMSKKCEEMLHETKEALKNEDSKLSKAIIKKDDIVDDLHKQVGKDCLEIMKKDSSLISQGVQFLYIARHLERSGDHITNICEHIIYIVDGKMVELG